MTRARRSRGSRPESAFADERPHTLFEICQTWTLSPTGPLISSLTKAILMYTSYRKLYINAIGGLAPRLEDGMSWKPEFKEKVDLFLDKCATRYFPAVMSDVWCNEFWGERPQWAFPSDRANIKTGMLLLFEYLKTNDPGFSFKNVLALDCFIGPDCDICGGDEINGNMFECVKCEVNFHQECCALMPNQNAYKGILCSFCAELAADHLAVKPATRVARDATVTPKSIKSSGKKRVTNSESEYEEPEEQVGSEQELSSSSKGVRSNGKRKVVSKGPGAVRKLAIESRSPVSLRPELGTNHMDIANSELSIPPFLLDPAPIIGLSPGYSTIQTQGNTSDRSGFTKKRSFPNEFGAQEQESPRKKAANRSGLTPINRSQQRPDFAPTDEPHTPSKASKIEQLNLTQEQIDDTVLLLARTRNSTTFRGVRFAGINSPDSLFEACAPRFSPDKITSKTPTRLLMRLCGEGNVPGGIYVELMPSNWNDFKILIKAIKTRWDEKTRPLHMYMLALCDGEDG